MQRRFLRLDQPDNEEYSIGGALRDQVLRWRALPIECVELSRVGLVGQLLYGN